MGRAVDVEPGLGRRLGPADLLADFGMEDLGPAAGQAAEAGVDQLLEHLARSTAGRSWRRTRSRPPVYALMWISGYASWIQRTTST